jgi:hypothetical protein
MRFPPSMTAKMTGFCEDFGFGAGFCANAETKKRNAATISQGVLVEWIILNLIC